MYIFNKVLFLSVKDYEKTLLSLREAAKKKFFFSLPTTKAFTVTVKLFVRVIRKIMIMIMMMMMMMMMVLMLLKVLMLLMMLMVLMVQVL